MQPCGTFNEDYKQDMAIVRTRLQWGLLIALLIILAVLPLLPFISRHILSLVNLIGITIITVHGLNILTGYCGQISLGQSAFMAIGAYTSAILVARAGFPFVAALPCAGLVAALLGLVVGIPALRIKGFYLALATIAAGFIVNWVIYHTPGLTGGMDGLAVPPAQLGGIVFDTEVSYYYLIMFFVVVLTAFAKNLARTRVGRAFIAIRDNDIAAETMGVSLARYKLLAFFICSFYAGIAGSLWAHYVIRIHPDQFALTESIWYLGMIVVGGMGSTVGAIFGTVFLRLLEEVVVISSPFLADLFPAVEASLFAGLMLIVFGVVIILFLIFEPRGLAHRWEIFKSYYRFWPFSY